jgi:protein TonB
MKPLSGTISLTRLFIFILSISIHVLIFLIPVSMTIKTKFHEIELFVSIENIQVPPESVKPQMATKKPQPEPVKEIIKPTEPSYPKIQNLGVAEPVKEVKKEPVEETKEELIKVKSNSQPMTESKEALFIPTLPSGTEGSTDVPTGEKPVGAASGVGKQPLVSHNAAGSDAGNLIETKFGASVAPAFLHREMPTYPMMARKLGREGRVMLKLTIDENGNLLNVEVIDKAGYGFTEAAVEAIKKSTFLPAKKDGKPIASRALLPVRFRLERN